MPDILIRGMEMPSKGYKTVILHSNGSVYEPTSNELILNKIADATGLPPHGDLIDRDNLEPDLAIWNGECGDPAFSTEAIDNAPVVVPASEEGSK